MSCRSSAVQIGVEHAPLARPRLRLRALEAAVLLLLIQHMGQMGIGQLGVGAQHHHMGTVAHLGVIGAVGPGGGLRDARLARLGAGDDEMPWLRIDRRRRVAQQGLDLLHLRGADALARVVGLGGVAGRGDLGDVHGENSILIGKIRLGFSFNFWKPWYVPDYLPIILTPLALSNIELFLYQVTTLNPCHRIRNCSVRSINIRKEGIP